MALTEAITKELNQAAAHSRAALALHDADRPTVSATLTVSDGVTNVTFDYENGQKRKLKHK